MRSNKLKRNIGLVSATSIGLGAMLGAGIFVFPGLAGGDAGYLALFSFLIGGIIALSVAACTAELATAMPNSGGGYFFISRSFGNFWGTLVGISQWIGLVFACAFYLVSFAEYAFTFLEELNIHWNSNKSILSSAFTLFLLLLNISGTKKVGHFQNIIVISLTVMLVLIFSYGILDFFGLEGKSLKVERPTSSGIQIVFTTTALIFTSYLGFVQIANVGAEIKNPSKNLPRALIWSVLFAVGLYIFIMAVCINTFPQEVLEKFGQNATIEVAREMTGNWGAIVVVFAGLLAALSSANASMISASRSVFALSNDQLISTQANTINKRFGTPHLALILVALPVAITLLRGELEILAEVASFLHLIIYAGICISLLKLRARNPIWFIPTFRVPAVKIVAGLGALSCIILIGFMQLTSILIGLGVLLLASAYYLVHVKKREIKLPEPQPLHLDADFIHPKILIPVDTSTEEKNLPETLIKAIPISGLLLLGFKETPEQSPSEQSEKKFAEESKKRLNQLEEQLNEASVSYDSELIFGDKIKSKIKEVIEEKQLQFILALKPLADLKHLVIPIFHVSQINKSLVTVVYNILSKNQTNIKVLLFVKKEDNPSNKKVLKQAMEQQLETVGIRTAEYEVRPLKKVSPKKVMGETSGETGIIIWSEAESSNRKFILDIILEKHSTDIASPSIVILKQENSDKPSEPS